MRLGITELTRTTIGTAASEILAGDALRDTIKGGAGGDFIIGFGGHNTMDGGAGFDSVSWYSEAFGVLIDLEDQADNGGAAAGDTVANFEAYYLTDFSDAFTGTDIGAFVYGFGGDDIIETGSGTDFIDGGAGADHIDAGGGFDYVSWNNSPIGLTIDMNKPAKNTGEARGDVIENAEAFYLSEHNDVFNGQNVGQNIVFGQAGNDRLYGGTSSNDWLFGGAGNDVLVGGTLNDLLSGGDGKDTYYFSNYRTNGLDQILDFVSGEDNLTFAGSGFGLHAGTSLHAGSSFIASSAPLPKAAGATFLYNTANGFLSFDPDGTGPDAAIALMQLSGHPHLAASDFHIA
jgi:Ca2+-binding RTX toxin-like protein